MEQVLNERLSDPATRGEPVALSIDLSVQGALEDELRRGMLATNAIGAAGVVLDVDTGEVLALASLPDFDPNLSTAQHSPNVFNRATNGTYELGSTFKPLSVAAAIDAGVVRDFTREWDASPVKMSGATIRDMKPKGSTLNVAQALAYSSNTVTVRIADALGPARLRQAMIDLGMSEPSPIELQARGIPQWTDGEWVAAEDDDGKLRPRDRGDAAAPCKRLRRDGQWRRCCIRPPCTGLARAKRRAAGGFSRRPRRRGCGNCCA